MSNSPLKIYFASPLFSDMEKTYNSKMVQELRDNFGSNVEIYLPQENEAINDKSGYADSKMIAQADTKELLESDLVIAVLDGSTVDVGVASEIGIAYQAGIEIIGLYTDSRQGTYGNVDKLNALDTIAESQFSYINLYTVGLIKNAFAIHNAITDSDGVVSKYNELLELVSYFIKLRNSDDRVEKSTVTYFGVGYVFQSYIEDKTTTDIHELIQSQAKLLGLGDGTLLTVLSIDDYKINRREINKIYREYTLNPTEYTTLKVEDLSDKYTAVVGGYHYNTIENKMNIKTGTKYYFNAVSEIADNLYLGNSVMVNTKYGTERLLVTEVIPVEDFSFRPTRDVIEII